MRNVKNVNICMYELFGLNYLPITDFMLTCHKKKQTNPDKEYHVLK